MSDEPPDCARKDWGNLFQQGLKFITSNEFNRQKDNFDNKLYPIIAKIMGQVSKSNIYWALDTYLKPFINEEAMRALLITWKEMDDNIFETTNEKERKKGISHKEIKKFIKLLKILSDKDIYLTSIPTASSKSLDGDKETWSQKYISSSVDLAKYAFVMVTKQLTTVVNSATRPLPKQTYNIRRRLEGIEEAIEYFNKDEGKELLDLWKAFRHSSKIALKFLINDPVNKLYYSILEEDRITFKREAKHLCDVWDKLDVNILKVDKDETYKVLKEHNRRNLTQLFGKIKEFVKTWSGLESWDSDDDDDEAEEEAAVRSIRGVKSSENSKKKSGSSRTKTRKGKGGGSRTRKNKK